MSMLKVQTIDDRVGTGSRISGGNGIYEARTKGNLQTRLYWQSKEETNAIGEKIVSEENYVAVVRSPTINEYKQFRTLADKMNGLFHLDIKTTAQDFVDFLQNGCDYGNDGTFKILPKDKIPNEVIENYEYNKLPLAAGIATATAFWGTLIYNISLINSNILNALLMLYGGTGFWFILPVLANIYVMERDGRDSYETFFPPSFALGHFPVKRYLKQEQFSGKAITKLEKLIKKHENLQGKTSAKLEAQTEKHGNLQNEFAKSSDVDGIIALKGKIKTSQSAIENYQHKLETSQNTVENYWDIIRLAQFRNFDKQRGVYARYETDDYADAYGFLDYIVNGGNYKPSRKMPKKAEAPASPREREIQRIVNQELKKRGVAQTNIVDLRDVMPKTPAILQEMTRDVPQTKVIDLMEMTKEEREHLKRPSLEDAEAEK